ncbi:MAG: molybdopterin biosynthesis protein MoeB [Cyanobacteria bacterium RYN_339]|nr:molybdopterin biosynthesis protein MoeB [Cyanobacteria bacterium RYN_339]
MPFNPRDPDQLSRYGRQLQLKQIGPAGQARLGGARVVVVGAGGLGCPALQYLAAAGVGALHVIDGDVVELSNLNRQVLYRPEDLGKPKAEIAAQRVGATFTHATLTRAQLHLLEADVVLDATDNFAARFLLADACRVKGIPLVQAAVTQFSGQLGTYLPGVGPCYRCFFPEPAGTLPGCAEAGILGAAAGVMGSLQALEAIKFLVGGPAATVSGHLVVLDLWTLSLERIALPPDPTCPLCGPTAWIRDLRDAGIEETP